jgi:hypothetical protein
MSRVEGFRHATAVVDCEEIQFEDGSWHRIVACTSRHGLAYRVDLADAPFVAFWYDEWVMSR